ncbi:MAG: type II toxin-antitoxin system VapC family toxin [Verrucomicrobiota bacterium]|jgi:PIN domain nuclease of toxin-antitoxin system|nr:type II toxin-antitoxin system VapC family toxin [Blastocatellia bacterium]MDQ3116743.1 type II toxin-antitoxin system VapC family toxin [Verrucomicrobiota bacterium]MDQ3545862.1 type II toxin-antitoxin system VapC family toxin [Verrucomicrobiota bacterium]
MTVLLDTHVWIWAVEAPENLGRRTTGLLEATGNSLAVSTMTVLEIARLVFLRRVKLGEEAAEWIADAQRALSVMFMDLTSDVAAAAYDLPGSFHKDPVDRVLVATARLHDLTLVTADDLILRYRHVKSFDARK